MMTYQVERFPEPSEPYDRSLHVSVKAQPTPDASLHNRVARVFEYGYRWRGAEALIRKAEVVVYGPRVEGFNAPPPAAPANGDTPATPPAFTG